MGEEREREFDRDPEVEQSPMPSDQTLWMKYESTTSRSQDTSAATSKEKEKQADSWTGNLTTAVKNSQPKQALKLAGEKPKDALNALESANLANQFYALVRAAKPYTGSNRRALTKLYNNAGSLQRKKHVFETRFSVNITVDSGATLTASELDNMHAQAILLPPGHVEGMTDWQTLRRTTSNTGGSYGNSRVSMGGTGNGLAAHSQTFRHEIGHAIDSKLGAQCKAFKDNQGGWKRYGTIKEAITAAGGFSKGLTGDLQAVALDAFTHFTTSNSGKQAAPGKFEDILKQKVEAKWGKGKKAATDNWNKLNGLFGTDVILDIAKASYSGGYAHWNYQNFKVSGGRAWFCNHYYAAVFSMPAATHNDIKAWGNSSAAFSDAEWFAEIYQEWYSSAKPGSSRKFPGFVQNFMNGPVKALGETHAPGAKKGKPA